MYKNRKLLACITSVCFLSIVSCSTGVILFADEESTISNENFGTMENFNDYITSSQGIIYVNGIDASSEDTMINLALDSSLLDSSGVVTKAITVDIPISITENPGFTKANMNLSIVNVDANNPIELEYNILNSNITAEKNGNSIQLSSNEVCSSDSIILIIQITIPENTITNGDMFDIKLTNVELINESNKYIPSVPEYLSLVITDDSNIDGTIIMGKPIDEDTEDTNTQGVPIDTTVTYTSIDTGFTTEPTTTTVIETEPTTIEPTTTTVATFTSKTTTTTTKITTTAEPPASVSQSNTSKTTVTTLISSGSGSGTTTTTTKVSNSGTSSSSSGSSTVKNDNDKSSKESSNTSKSGSVSKESSSIEKESESLDTGSRGILGIVMASLVSISTAFATKKKS